MDIIWSRVGVEHNINVICGLNLYPNNRIRVQGNLLSHDDRYMSSFTRALSGDGRDHVLCVIEDTMDILQVLVGLGRDLPSTTESHTRLHHRLRLIQLDGQDFIDGLGIFEKTYNDANVSLRVKAIRHNFKSLIDIT
jgi:hypothetical protein